MAANLLVLLVVVPLLLVGPLLVGLLGWALLRPADGEPPARARLRRGTGTTAAVATTVSVLVLLPSLVLALSSPAAGAVGVLVAAVLHVTTLWVGESLAARPHAVRRSALLTPQRRGPVRTLLLGVLGLCSAGVVVVLGLAVAGAALHVEGLPGAVPPRVGVVLLVPSVLLAVLVSLALRQVATRATDGRLDPLVDAAGRARATHRLLRAGAGAAAAVLGLLLAGAGLQADGAGGTDGGDGAAGTLALVAGAVVLLVAAACALLPAPPLPVRPDSGGPEDHDPAGATAGAGPGDA